MKIQRLIAILATLLQKDVVSSTWFAEKFGVSVRTIYRDIEALESAGIPIVTHTGVNGGISIIDEYKIDKKLFTNADISALLTGLQSVSGSVSDVQMNMTLEKIKSLIPGSQAKSIELKSRQLYIDMTAWAQNPSLTRKLNSIKTALDENKLLCFDYAGRNDHSANRTVEPHQLVLKENSWYLRAYCTEKQDFRTFKLTRIKDMRALEKHFTPRAFENTFTDFKDWIAPQSTTVKLLVTEAMRERVLDHCREEYLQEVEGGKILVTIPFVESDMGYGVLLGFGHDCKVLEPPQVRDELVRRIDLLREVYR